MLSDETSEPAAASEPMTWARAFTVLKLAGHSQVEILEMSCLEFSDYMREAIRIRNEERSLAVTSMLLAAAAAQGGEAGQSAIDQIQQLQEQLSAEHKNVSS